MEIEYTVEQAKMFGLNCKIPSVVIDTWDMESNEKKALFILSVMPKEDMRQYNIRPKEICIHISESEKIEMVILEGPLWAVPRKKGYNFLIVEEIIAPDCPEEGSIGEVIILEMTKTYNEAEERRSTLLSS